jgi:hypothetical protein
MKTIETKYKGYRFRSRLEARWAVFFDALGVKWEYEPEGFDLGKEAGWYLPDFFLPELGYWIEVKGGMKNGIEPCAEDKRKILHFSSQMPFDNSMLVVGDLPEERQSHLVMEITKDPYKTRGGHILVGKLGFITKFYFDDAPSNLWRFVKENVQNIEQRIGMATPERIEATIDDDRHNYGFKILNYYVTCFRHHVDIKFAYDKARQARFEHGECGL